LSLRRAGGLSWPSLP